jgi:ABC-type multidrug transport system ATPase subunit
MNNYSISLKNIKKVYGRRLIFSDINFVFESGRIYGLAGSNGSGKSTLAKIIAGIISPTSGKLIHKYDNKDVKEEKLHEHLGFVSPYLILYDEFTAEENLIYFAEIRDIKYDKERIDRLLEEFKLLDRKNDLVKGYSSGMKQRLKFIFAMLHNPDLLILDEPTSNLDNKGKNRVYEIIKEQGKDKLVIVASNEDGDLDLCSEIIDIEKFKNKL